MKTSELPSFGAKDIMSTLGSMADALDETLRHTFWLRMEPVPVTLRTLKRAALDCMDLLVTW